MITEVFDPHSPALISPEQAVPPEELALAEQFELPTFILFFSNTLLELLAESGRIEPLHPRLTIGSAAGRAPIYRLPGTRIGVALSGIGAPAAAGVVEELRVQFHTKSFLVFGSCGALTEIPPGRLILPTEARRDEGTSYHYAPAAAYISIPKAQKLARIFDELGVDYVEGRTWTTDAFYRETENNLRRRVADGCVCVEMECSALQAVCDFRGLDFYPFFYSADSLHGAWSRRILGAMEKDSRLLYFDLAAAVALRLASYPPERPDDAR